MTEIPGQTWSVLLSDITKPETIQAIVEKEAFSDHKPPYLDVETDEIGMLSGGYILVLPDGATLGFECCSDLGTLDDWKGAAAYREAGWKHLWIGHPSSNVRFVQGRLEISRAVDEHVRNEDVFARLRPEELTEMIQVAEEEVERFKSRLIPVLQSMGMTGSALEVADAIVWRRYP